MNVIPRARGPTRSRDSALGQQHHMTDLAKLVGHTIWANDAWIRFIEAHCPDDTAIRERISHVLLGERVWFQRIAGEQPDRDIWTVMSVAALHTMQEAHRATYMRLLSGDTARSVTYRRFTGEAYRSPVSDILMHLGVHGAHHRGQLATLASARGLKPVNTDFVQFCLTHRV
jgi:uncharacterized damage-inducible protein DinB